MKPKIIMVGTGAVGTYFGAKLIQGGAHLTFLARSDYQVIYSNGIRVLSKDGDITIPNCKVIKDAAEYKAFADFVLLSLKGKPKDYKNLIGAVVGPKTVIAVMQNGIGVEEELNKAFPDNKILGVSVMIGASRLASGLVQHHHRGILEVGIYPQGCDPVVTKFAEFFTQSGVPCTVEERILESRWKKLVWNAVFNPLSVAGGGAHTKMMVTEDRAKKWVKKAMAEIIDLAKAYGFDLGYDLIEKNMKLNIQFGAYKTSMLQDYEEGLPLEIEPILGNLLAQGKSKKIELPYINALYQFMRMI